MSMSHFNFIKVTGADWETVSAIEKSAGSLYSPRKGKKRIQEYIKDCSVYFIQRGKERMGFISYKTKKNGHIEFDGLVLFPKYRGKGIATAALKKIMEDLGDQHYSSVVHPENSPAIKVYLGLGFVIKAWKNNYFKDGQPRLVMEKMAK